MSLPNSSAELATLIDSTLLRADATLKQIETLCADARKHGFRGVCVNGVWVNHARAYLEDSDVKIICTAGFPLGANSSDVKRFEAEAAIDDGAQELDLVINIGRLKSGDDKYVLRELRDVAEAADERPVNVILETSLLARDEIIRASHLILDSGAKCVVTSTGFSETSDDANLEVVKLLRESVGPEFGIKASGVRDAKTALAFIEVGATRLGVCDAVAVLTGFSK
jgi:deoxyribose-phosphate aldolase